MMFYPPQPMLNDLGFVVHCAHPECNDESYFFNSIETVATWISKHDDAHEDHPDVDTYIYKRFGELIEDQVYDMASRQMEKRYEQSRK